jgi:phosphoribosylformimino-5-aminoimidazole carboxamide ribotide isomerase
MSQPFTIFPAIDLKDGKVVRLQQGRADAETVYSDDPAAVARRWQEQGARFLHVVDLDGAFQGKPANTRSVEAILASITVPVQLGGGLRSRSSIEMYLKLGVSRVVVGTKACSSPEFVRALVDDFGPRIVVGIDSRDGFVAVKGWTERTECSTADFAQQIDGLGVGTLIFTDIATDGMLAGPNYFAVSGLCAAVRCSVIASGGISNLNDVRRLQRVAADRPNLVGAIVGKALYDGKIDLRQLSEPAPAP